MNPKRKAIGVAVAGTALGVAGLTAIAIPAGAGEAPELPPVGAEALVESVLSADMPALAGTVEVDNELGLPSMPGVPTLDAESARVYNDGDGRSRLAVQDGGSERTIVHDGTVVWTYDSAENTATKIMPPKGSEADHAPHGVPGGAVSGQPTDPTAMAAAFVDAVGEHSTVSVDGTARVAERPAYELVLTPKPSERTLLREVRVAVDSETRLPLRLGVFTNGTTEPALEVGFSDLEFGAQPADLFRFTPPEGAKVETERPEVPERVKDERPELEVVGEGWDTVVVGEVPEEFLSTTAGETDVRGLLGQVGKRVTGDFGAGYVIATDVGTALLTDDGRFAFGAVPEPVVTQAVGSR